MGIDDIVKMRLKKIIEVSKKIGLDNLNNEQYKILNDINKEKKRTNIVGLKYWHNLKLFVDDGYNSIVKNKKMFVPF